MTSLTPPDPACVRAQADGRTPILIVAPSVVGTFVRQDLEILKSAFDARLFAFTGVGSLPALRRRLVRAQAVLIWFAGRHSGPTVWLARRYRRPVITIVGGYEAAWVPEIGYGVPPGSLRARLLRWVLRNSDRILAVSSETEAGVARVAPDVTAKTRLVYNAIDTDRFHFDIQSPRSGVLSVGAIDATTLVKKGWTLFWETACAMPDVSFTAVGPARDRTAREFVARRPRNLQWLGSLAGDDLLAQYQNAAVYFQGSRHESFSLSLAEGMACGCVPVVSHHGALPEVAGDIGYYLDDVSPAAAISAIRRALAAPESRRREARQRIVDRFDIERRRQTLCAEVKGVLQ